MRLSADMRRSIAVAAGTRLLPGTRVRWKAQGLEGKVRDLSLSFDGKYLSLDGVTVQWDRLENEPDDNFCTDELHMLEILP